MKTKLTFLALCFIMITNAYSQTEQFVVGWYQVLSGAQVKVVQGNSDDANEKTDWTATSYAANEVLLAFNFSKDKYYCYDPDGRVVLVKGKGSLKKIDMLGRPARITQEVKIGLDLSIGEGNNVWLVGFNPTNKTAKILLANGTVQEVPQDSVQDLKDYMDLMDKFTEWHTVE